MDRSAKQRRISVFHEIGLDDEDLQLSNKSTVINDTRQPTGPVLSYVKIGQIAALFVLLGFIIPKFQSSKIVSQAVPLHASAGPVVQHTTRQTDVCKRWAGQSALVNGTLYYYGGRSMSSADQTTNTWNNDLIALDLTKSWQISSPALTNLPTPSGPPAVSLGSLWSSNNALYLYGGEFSDSPVTSPVPFALWSYDIKSKDWAEHSNPKFADGSPVQRAAEGAGVSVPSLEKGYYFGGHLDGYTTADWSQSVPRVYLEALLEYDMSSGEYRNITADSAGFPERADGSLVYVPGYGASGIILGLAGGTNQTFTQLNVIDVYDIAESKWYKQATSGTTPEIRVNPCTVAASSADGSSTQVYMFGGQNLTPYGNQTQYNDMWILTIPAFTWIKVNMDNQAIPPARAGHTCNIWNSQMVVVGGYVGQDLSCDSPGIYVFNTSSLSWETGYVALSGSDPLNRQASQQDDPNALQGSYDYDVPLVVQSAIGGNSAGGATVTMPIQTPTQGPLATGTAPKYSSPQTTDTATPGGHKPNVGAIVAGVIAAILFLMAIYLAFCAWVYRRQLKLYKRHAALIEETRHNPYAGQFAPSKRESSSADRSSDRRQHRSHTSYVAAPVTDTAASSTDDLLRGQEPNLLGIMLNPRRSLRVVNRD